MHMQAILEINENPASLFLSCAIIVIIKTPTPSTPPFNFNGCGSSLAFKLQEPLQHALIKHPPAVFCLRRNEHQAMADSNKNVHHATNSSHFYGEWADMVARMWGNLWLLVVPIGHVPNGYTSAIWLPNSMMTVQTEPPRGWN